jgi:hypothetical protein
VDGVLSQLQNIEFFRDMDSYLSGDLEESLWECGNMRNPIDPFPLAGMFEIYISAYLGRVEDILETLNRGKGFASALGGACHGGRKELALLILERYICDPHWGLLGACSGGQKEIALMMISLTESYGGKINWDWGLEEAVRYNHRELVLLMIERGADLHRALAMSCKYGRRGMVLLIIQKIESSRSDINYNWALAEACSLDRQDLVLLMIQKMKSSKAAIDFSRAITRACAENNEELVMLLIAKGADPNKGLSEACANGFPRMVLSIIRKIESSGGVADWDWGLANACHYRQKELVKLMIQKGAKHCMCDKHLEDH